MESAKPQQGANMTEKVTGIPRVFIPKGCFQMGSVNGDADESPVHEVCVDGYWMSKYEVTQGQGRQTMDENPPFNKGDNYPKESVS